MGKGVVIADIDSGCQTTHPDLRHNIIGQQNFTKEGGSKDVHDALGHGTHTAGIMAAAFNQTGVTGVAPSAQLLILKMIGRDGKGDYASLIDALNYAVNWQGPNGEKVTAINLSLGGSEHNAKLHEVIKRAYEHNIAVIAASGNQGDGYAQTQELLYPGIYPEVIEAGAVDKSLNIAFFSNTNREIDFVAPGTDILSTFPEQTYVRMSGTSMAAPHVTGAFALYYSKINQEDRYSIQSAYDYFKRNARDLDAPRKAQGWGFIQFNS